MLLCWCHTNDQSGVVSQKITQTVAQIMAQCVTQQARDLPVDLGGQHIKGWLFCPSSEKLYIIGLVM
jgi:hypothetical protein